MDETSPVDDGGAGAATSESDPMSGPGPGPAAVYVKEEFGTQRIFRTEDDVVIDRFIENRPRRPRMPKWLSRGLRSRGQTLEMGARLRQRVVGASGSDPLGLRAAEGLPPADDAEDSYRFGRHMAASQRKMQYENYTYAGLSAQESLTQAHRVMAETYWRMEPSDQRDGFAKEMVWSLARDRRSARAAGIDYEPVGRGPF